MFSVFSMTDQEALDFLAGKLDGDANVARALTIKPQTLGMWRTRKKISAKQRPKVWAMINDKGRHLPREWLMA